MSAISRNIVTNALGGGWVVLLTLAVIPVQLGILGIEAYGLIGVLAILQTAFGLLDLGMGATLLQRTATDSTPTRAATLELTGTAIAVYTTTATVAGLALALNADWLSQHWLQLTTLSPDTVATAVQLIVIAVVMRCPVALCSALISGLNRLDTLNLLKAGAQSLRLLGGLVVLIVYRELLPLLWWEIAATLAELMLYLLACRRLLPDFAPWPRYAAGAMHGRWHYALGMNAIAAIALLLTQADKFAISKALPLEYLGLYHLAYSATAWIALIQGGFNSAVLPSFAADFAAGRRDLLRTRNAKITQLTVYAVALPAVALLMFSADFLAAWVDAATAAAAAGVAALLAAGFLLNAAVSNCLTLAVASGHAGIPLRVNLLGLAIYLPALALLLDAWGITGAALAWVVLNTYYLVVLVPIVQKRLLGQGYFSWLRANFLPFVLLALVLFALARAGLYALTTASAWLTWSAIVGAAAGYVLLGYRLLDGELRMQIVAFLQAHGRPARVA
jgi:O-antigen/teichoic acid export membrane protein